PRSTSQERMGMFSYQARTWPQLGHLEPGLTTDSPAGTRAITTLRKLPTTRPSNPARMGNVGPRSISHTPAATAASIVRGSAAPRPRSCAAGPHPLRCPTLAAPVTKSVTRTGLDRCQAGVGAPNPAECLRSWTRPPNGTVPAEHPSPCRYPPDTLPKPQGVNCT